MPDPTTITWPVLEDRRCVICGVDFRPGDKAVVDSRVAGGPVYRHYPACPTGTTRTKRAAA